MRAHAPRTEAGPRLAHEEDKHTSFFRYRNYFYLKIATVAVIVSIALYYVDVPYGERYGGTWAGYILGTAGALLILWLMWFGYRKRSYRVNQGKLEAWLSAHVYLGGALLAIATLHTGWHIGWNIHTAAYLLMCAVIFSGFFGIFCYLRYPTLITDNRGGNTMPQILVRIAVINDELRMGAMTIDDATAKLVTEAVERTEIGGSGWRQMSGTYPNCATDKALVGVNDIASRSSLEQQATYRQVLVLLNEKKTLLARARRDVSYKAMMDVWLYFHVPLSFALLAALTAHVVSVFFYW
ncbi:MAG TPA: hypothetical protein VN802_11155 [Stellaceae bacterium]|nr:hypothetical protein [Stellaceae bacterium]